MADRQRQMASLHRSDPLLLMIVSVAVCAVALASGESPTDRTDRGLIFSVRFPVAGFSTRTKRVREHDVITASGQSTCPVHVQLSVDQLLHLFCTCAAVDQLTTYLY